MSNRHECNIIGSKINFFNYINIFDIPRQTTSLLLRKSSKLQTKENK